MMKNLKCSHKGHEGDRLLPITFFSKHPGTSTGRQSVCRKCNSRLIIEKVRKKTQENKERQGRLEGLDYEEIKAELDYYGCKVIDYKDPYANSSDVWIKDLVNG